MDRLFGKRGDAPLIAALVGILVCQIAAAQPQPATDRHLAHATPLKIIDPFPTGSAPDILARDLAKRIHSESNRPIVVNNKPGAGGNIGTQTGVNAPPDGNTLLLTAHRAITIHPLFYQKLKFDPLRDLVGVTRWRLLPPYYKHREIRSYLQLEEHPCSTKVSWHLQPSPSQEVPLHNLP